MTWGSGCCIHVVPHRVLSYVLWSVLGCLCREMGVETHHKDQGSLGGVGGS